MPRVPGCDFPETVTSVHKALWKVYDINLLQIETDLLRTLPNNKHYECMNADGIPKLRRVLLAFSIYNADVGYCQVY
jgi:hypothetical protein